MNESTKKIFFIIAYIGLLAILLLLDFLLVKLITELRQSEVVNITEQIQSAFWIFKSYIIILVILAIGLLFAYKKLAFYRFAIIISLIITLILIVIFVTMAFF